MILDYTSNTAPPCLKSFQVCLRERLPGPQKAAWSTQLGPSLVCSHIWPPLSNGLLLRRLEMALLLLSKDISTKAQTHSSMTMMLLHNAFQSNVIKRDLQNYLWDGFSHSLSVILQLVLKVAPMPPGITHRKFPGNFRKKSTDFLS